MARGDGKQECLGGTCRCYTRKAACRTAFKDSIMLTGAGRKAAVINAVATAEAGPVPLAVPVKQAQMLSVANMKSSTSTCRDAKYDLV